MEDFGMNDNVKTVKQVCKCENCGNEAEMVVTCALDHSHDEVKAPAQPGTGTEGKVQGTATCSHCGNEADMWIDI